MELIAKKRFRIEGGFLVKKGDRFISNSAMGQIYLLAKIAEHPPREPEPEPAPQTYQTRHMEAAPVSAVSVKIAADGAGDSGPVKRKRGRPRKVRPE